MKNYIFSLPAILILTCVQGQTEYFGTLDPCNFNYIIIDSVPTVKYIEVPSSTFDNLNQHYIFSGSPDGLIWKLYTINVNNGNVISNPLFPVLSDPNDNIINWQYSNSQNKLLAMHWDNSQNTEYFVSINTNTGAFTIIDSLPSIKYIQGFATIDNINNRYIVRASPNTNTWYLYSINTSDGSIISNPPYPNPNGNLIEYQYSNSLNKLIALHWDNLSNTEYLAEVNPGNGTFTDINSIPGVAWIQGGYTTFDDYNKRYLFRGGDNSGNWYLYSIDAVNGNVSCNPVFPTSTTNDNIEMPQMDSLTGIMYALHWESVTNGIKEKGGHISNFFPNPLIEDAKLTLDKTYNDIILFIYNASGQVVCKQTAANTSEIYISRGNLSEGQYFISVICDHIYLGTVNTSIR
ncbi:MAG: T9SS type A sorting domain-containing protein [Bacteroidia bacterium]